MKAGPHIMGDRRMQTWEDHPDRDEYRLMNHGLGACNTGSGKRIICCLGGIHCDIDHARIVFERAAA